MAVKLNASQSPRPELWKQRLGRGGLGRSDQNVWPWWPSAATDVLFVTVLAAAAEAVAGLAAEFVDAAAVMNVSVAVVATPSSCGGRSSCSGLSRPRDQCFGRQSTGRSDGGHICLSVCCDEATCFRGVSPPLVSWFLTYPPPPSCPRPVHCPADAAPNTLPDTLPDAATDAPAHHESDGGPLGLPHGPALGR